MRLWRIIAVWICLAVLPGAALAGKGDFNPDFEPTVDAITRILETPERLPLPIERIRPALEAYYVTNKGKPYWIGTGRMTPFIQRLQRAADDGLNPDDYPIESLIKVRDRIDPADPATAAEAELYFSAFFVAYAADLKIGRVIPQKIDPHLFRNRKTIDVLRVLTELNTYRDPGKYLAAFEPRNPQYQSLKKLLRYYRALEKEGGWAPVNSEGPPIKPGMTDQRIPEIREHLILTGDYQGETAEGPLYDPQLAEAVKRFQARHGLEAKGLIGKQTLMAINVPVKERLKQIMLNMERWRWMPEDPGEEHILVNIAAYELQRRRNDEILDRMKVVVGAAATQTPEFSDELEYVDINPTWTVPYSIATKEMLPKLRANRFAYAEDFEVFMNGKLVSWSGINWGAYGPGRFPFTFRQKPGPKNALGRVKFMLPNKHNIYLHDTPAKDKFAATARAFSHGCIRLSRPFDFAYAVLGDHAGWSRDRIDAAIETGKTTRVTLQTRIPVHLIYATAFLGEDGTIEFRPDVYGRDRKLYNALFGRPTSS